MKKTLAMIAFAWGVILLSLYAYTDLMMPAVNQNSDYLMTFYTAGHLVNNGNLQALYPSPGSSTFVDCSFDKAAHQFLPLLPVRATAEFMYMPAVAGLFSPFSLLSPSYSLLCWQFCSLAALGICVWLFSAKLNKELNGLTARAFWSALTLIPLAVSIWIGQISVVFGLLPLLVGLFFLLKSKNLTAGLAWSLTVIKPQFFIPALMMTVALASAKNYKPLVGIISGAALFTALNLILFPADLFSQWLATLKLADVVYSDLKSGVAQHIATSLPRAIILLAPMSQHSIVKPIAYLLALLLGCAGLYFCVRLVRSNLPDTTKFALSMLICVFATPMIVPHVFFYDYAIFAAAGFIAFAIKWPDSVNWRISSLVYLGWLIINIYGVIVLTNKNFAIPILFVLLMLELYRRILVVSNEVLKPVVITHAAVESANDQQQL